MEYLVIFNLLILVLFFLSHILTRTIFSFLHKATRSERFSTNALALIFFPGVLVHELAHLLTAKVFGVHTGKMHLLPKNEGNSVALGSVNIARSNFFFEFLISVAPLVIGTGVILFTVYLVLNTSDFLIPKSLFAIYLIFVISNTMYVSKKDMGYALPFLTLLITAGVALFVIGVRFPVVTLTFLPNIELARIFYIGTLYLGIPIIIDLTVILLIRIMSYLW